MSDIARADWEEEQRRLASFPTFGERFAPVVPQLPQTYASAGQPYMDRFRFNDDPNQTWRAYDKAAAQQDAYNKLPTLPDTRVGPAWLHATPSGKEAPSLPQQIESDKQLASMFVPTSIPEAGLMLATGGTGKALGKLGSTVLGAGGIYGMTTDEAQAAKIPKLGGVVRGAARPAAMGVENWRLPMDEASRMARATEQGFGENALRNRWAGKMLDDPEYGKLPHIQERYQPIERTWFHGTQAPGGFDEFKFGGVKRQTADWNTMLGPHFSDSPGVASDFATGLYSKNEFGGSVIPAQLKIANPKTYKSETDLSDDAVRWAVDKGLLTPADFKRGGMDTRGIGEEIAKTGKVPDWGYGFGGEVLKGAGAKRKQIADGFRKELTSAGHDGIVYGNNVEGVATSAAIPFASNQVRSKFAAFDPENAGSGKLIGGVLGGTAVGAVGAAALSPDQAEAAKLPQLGGVVRGVARAPELGATNWKLDFPTPGYHGTNQVFERFKNPPVDMQLDRALGTHIAADPALASSFADRFFPLPGSSRTEVKGAPNVIPVNIPPRKEFLQVDQPILPNYISSSEPMWRRVATDERQIERMMAKEGYQSDPMMLQRYLQQARAMQPREAEKAARTMAEGGQANVDIGKADLDRFLKNYGGRPYNQADRERMVEIARDVWEGKGHKGLRYINTAPVEAGAPGVVDPTSYIVFNPKNIVSRFGGSVLGAAVPGGMLGADMLGETVRQDRYNSGGT